jgi:hypothetical protein
MAPKKPINQKVVLNGIPANQQRQRDLRATKREEQRPRSLTESLGSWGRTALNNFRENASRPIGDRPRSRDHETHHKGQKGHRGSAGLNIPSGPMLDPDFLGDQGGIDFSMHPDPMYQSVGKRKRSSGNHEGARSVTVTTRTYRYD